MQVEAKPHTRQMKPADVAAELDVPVSRVWGWIKKGWLDATELPRGMYRISPEAVARFLDEKPWLEEG